MKSFRRALVSLHSQKPQAGVRLCRSLQGQVTASAGLRARLEINARRFYASSSSSAQSEQSRSFASLSAQPAHHQTAEPLPHPGKANPHVPRHAGAFEDPFPHASVHHPVKAHFPFFQTRPSLQRDRLLVVFDLDETLVHCKQVGGEGASSSSSSSSSSGASSSFAREPDFRIVLPGSENRGMPGPGTPIVGWKRPGVDELLHWAAANYDLALYTAGTQEYADAILSLLDPAERLIPRERRLYRQDCRPHNLRLGGDGQSVYLKDLSKFEGRHQLNRIVLVDNNVLSFLLNPDNGILVNDFLGDALPPSPPRPLTRGGLYPNAPRGAGGALHAGQPAHHHPLGMHTSDPAEGPGGSAHGGSPVMNEWVDELVRVAETLERVSHANDVRDDLRQQNGLLDRIVSAAVIGMSVGKHLPI